MTPPRAMLVDLTSPEFTRDPFPFYERLRESAPVHRQPHGSWLITRYRDCVAALEHPDFTNVQEIRCYPDSPGDGPALDPPESPYSQMRKVVAKALAPSLMREFEGAVRKRVDELIDAAVEAGEIDVVDSLGYPLGAVVFCDLFGIPAADRARFRAWVDEMVHSVDLLVLDSPELKARSDAARLEFSAYLWRLIDERRRSPAGDLLSRIVAIQHRNPALTDMELIAFCITLFIAGHASTSAFIAFAVHALLQHPDQLRRLREDPDIAQPAIEELTRHASPTHFTIRAARRDVEFSGQKIAQGEVVACVIGSANRDPEVFDDPSRLDLGRTPNPHIAFGHGHHFCLGAHLARLEARLMLESLVRRAPTLRQLGEPTHKPSVWMRGLASLPVSLR